MYSLLLENILNLCLGTILYYKIIKAAEQCIMVINSYYFGLKHIFVLPILLRPRWS